MAERDVSISFDKAGSGWADVTLRVGAQHLTLDAISYTTDALGDLVRAALQIAVGGSEVTVCFDREPVEWRLTLLAHGQLLALRVLDFPDISDAAAEEQGRERFKAECDREAFAQAVADAAARVLADVQPNGFARWSDQNPFPYRAFGALQAALVTSDQPPAASA